MLVGLLLSLSASANPWSGLLQTLPDTLSVACADQPHRAVHPLTLSEPGLVYVEVSDWDSTVVLGLSEGATTCHGALQPPAPLSLDAEAPQVLVRWLPAGTHRVELTASEPATAIVSVSVVTPSELTAFGMAPTLAEAALLAADHAWTDGHAKRPSLAILDYSRPSTEERLWVVDLSNGQLTHHLFVSHGKGSGHSSDKARAVRFSNKPFSNQTSLGLFRASETYTGDHGRSLRLDGLEPTVNDLARDRAIVIHGADYARVEHIDEWGYLGRSHGCPAIDDRAVQAVIDDLHNGGLVYARGTPKRPAGSTLRAGTEDSPDAPYLPDPLGLVSIY